MGEALEEEARLGGASARGQDYVHGLQDAARASAAALLGADPEEVCLTHSTTEGVNIVLHGLPWQPGEGLVLCDLEHPAITGPAQVLAERRGVAVAKPAVAPAASPGEIIEAVRQAVTPRTRLVALSHIQFTCGLRMPIREIAALAHERGALLLVDGAQTAGQLDLDVRELGVDFYSVSGQKWLMGPSGTGALYVRRGLAAKLEPLFITNAMADGRPFMRAPLARFAIASQSPGLLAGFAEAVRLARDAGLPAIEERSRGLGALLAKAAGSVPGCRVLSATSAATACGLTTIALEGWEPPKLVETLQGRFGIMARSVGNPAGVRFSTHYWNTEEEVARVAEALGALTGAATT